MSGTRPLVVALSAALLLSGCSVLGLAPGSVRPTPSSLGESAPTAVSGTAVTPTAGTPTDWPGVVGLVQESVVRLDVVGCDERWTGSGFMLDGERLVTAAHVVEGAVSIQVQRGLETTAANVVAVDRDDDSALVLTERALTGAGLSLSDSEPRLGEEIAILGFPLHTYDLRISRGVISGLREQVSYPNGISANSAYVTDAAINGGNSGGPVVNSRGQVVGLVTGKRLWVSGGNPGEGAVEGTGYVVPSLLLSTNLTRWVAQPLAAVPTCAGDEEPPADDGGMLQVTLRTADPLAAELARSLALHGEAINRGSYSAAWEIFTPAMQRRMKDMNQWKAGLETSLWTALDVVDVSSTGSRADARVVLQTVQDRAFGYQGQTCSLWSSRYTMVNSSGGWLIDAVDAGRGPTPC